MIARLLAWCVPDKALHWMTLSYGDPILTDLPGVFLKRNLAANVRGDFEPDTIDCRPRNPWTNEPIDNTGPHEQWYGLSSDDVVTFSGPGYAERAIAWLTSGDA